MSSSSKIKIDGFQKAVAEIVSEYGDKALDVVGEQAVIAAKKAAKELKAKSPKDTGRYAKGWTTQVVKERTSVSAVVYNKDRYQLAHLLENGHAIRGGGRTVGQKEHIYPVNESIQESFFKGVKDNL